MVEKLKPMDLIAIITIIGCFILIFYQRDGYVAATLTLITGYYFGKRASSLPIEDTKTQNNEQTDASNN